jgi:hypothetical protein
MFAQSTDSRTIALEASRAFVFKSIEIPPRSFVRAELVSIARRFLREYIDKHVAVICIYVDREQAQQMFAGKEMYDSGWEYWRKSYERLSRQTSWEIAQLVRIKGSATLRVCWPDQTIEEIPLLGPNVFHQTIQNNRFNLLWIEPERKLGGGDYQRLHACLYVDVPEHLDRNEALMISRTLITEIDSNNVAVHIRADSWFVSSMSYPTINPFHRELVGPDKNAINRSPEYFCSPDQRQTCYEFPHERRYNK